ncbi:MAG: carboxypeptidase regulatory-like domain-containing protein [Gemmatimonadales bacterium]
MRRFVRLALTVSSVLAAFLALPAIGAAQGVTTGAISGVVSDSAGGAIEDAIVRVSNLATGFNRTVTTRSNGSYFVGGLEIGRYRVAVTAIGFRPGAVNEVRVALTQTVRADVALVRQAVQIQELVTVAQADAAVFAPTRTGPQLTISDSQVRRLPTLNRQLQDFIRISPQVTTNPGAGGSLSAAGQSNRYNAIQVDGTTQNDRFGLGDTGELGGQAGGRGISLEAIKEYQIVISPFNVTQGGFTGALVNAVTKNGTNRFTGSAFYTFRNQELATNDPFIAQNEFSIKQFGASIGGPIIKDKLHFFLAGELNRSTRPAGGPFVGQLGVSGANAVRVDQATVDRFNAALAQYGIEGGSGGAQSNENPIGNLVARLDWQVSPSSRVVIREIYNDQKADDFSRSAGTFALTSNRFKRSEQVNSLTGQFFKTFGNGASNEFQLGLIRQRFARAFDQNGPQITVTNINSPTVSGQTVNLRAGPDSSSHVNQLDQDFIELRNDLTFPVGGGNHLITVGTRNDLYKVRNAFVQNAFGSWGFSSLADLEAGIPNRYAVGVALGDDPVARFRAANVSFYVQDQWTLNPDLSLTLGLRAEAPIFLDEPGFRPEVERDFGRRTDVVPSNFTFNPRLGFNWDVSGTGTTQLRGGVGFFAGTPPYVWLSNLFTNNGLSGTTQFTCDGNSGRPAAPAFNTESVQSPPQVCAGGVGPTSGTSIGAVNTVDPNYKQTQILRASLGGDHRLPWGLIGTFDALYTKAYNSPFMVNLALGEPVGTDFAGRVMYGTIAANGRATTNCTTPNIYSCGAYDLRNSSNDYAYSISGGLTKRMAGSLETSVFYTYGHSYSVQDFTSSVARSNFQNGRVTALNQYDDRADRSSFDIPHRIAAAVTWTAPWKDYGTDISLIYNGQSGTAFTYIYQSQTVGGNLIGDLNADGFFGNDPVYIPNTASEYTFEQYTGPLVTNGPNAPVTPALQAAAFDEFISSLSCLDSQRGQIQTRNSCRNPWFNTMNLSVRQSLPGLGGHRLSLQADIYNFLNFLNNDWGQYRQNTRFSQQNLLPVRGFTAEGRPIVRFDPRLTDRDFAFAKNLSSTNYWQGQVTARYSF